MIIIVPISIISIIIILSRQGLIYFVFGVSLKEEELDQKSCEQFLDMCHKVMGRGEGEGFKKIRREHSQLHISQQVAALRNTSSTLQFQNASNRSCVFWNTSENRWKAFNELMTSFTSNNKFA